MIVKPEKKKAEVTAQKVQENLEGIKVRTAATTTNAHEEIEIVAVIRADEDAVKTKSLSVLEQAIQTAAAVKLALDYCDPLMIMELVEIILSEGELPEHDTS